MASIINGESSPGYYVTPTGITIGGRTKEYATIADMLADTNPGKFARVADATGDTTVKSGAAIYRREGTDWVKVYEEESMDLETKITWDTLSGKPDVTAAAIEAACTKAHQHQNSTVLAKIGVDTNGNLTLDGNAVGGEAATAISRLNVVEPIVSGLQNTVDAHATSIGALETDKHNHYNKEVLDQLSVSEGKLQLNGVDVDSDTVTDLTNYYTKAEVDKEIDDQHIFEHCTAYEVYANSAVIPAGSNEIGLAVWNDANLKNKYQIPISMTEVVAIYVTKTRPTCDVVIDWGDGTVEELSKITPVNGTSNDNKVDVSIEAGHTYSATGKYIVKIYGKDYNKLRHNTSGINNLVCRVFSTDLPIAHHLINLSSFCYGSKRLLKVEFPSYTTVFSYIINWQSTFNSCSNLISCTGWQYFNKNEIAYGALFSGCNALTTTDFKIGLIPFSGIDSIFVQCYDLEVNIVDLFRTKITTDTKEISARVWFMECSKLHLGVTNTAYEAELAKFNNGEENTLEAMKATMAANASKLGELLWNNHDIVWKNIPDNYNRYPFHSCSQIFLSYIPMAWGGTASNDSIIAPVQDQIDTLDTTVSTHGSNADIHVTVVDKTTWSGKQDAITGTSGQFVKIGSNGTPVAETIDLTEFGSVKTVNGVEPDANGNVSITVGSDVDLTPYYTSAQTDSAISSAIATETGLRETADSSLSGRITVLETAKDNMTADISAVTGLSGSNAATITVHDGKISALEANSHAHKTSNNYVFVNEVFGCTEKVEAYKSFKQFETEADIKFDNKIVAENGYILIGNDKLFWTYATSAKYNNEFEDLTSGVSGFTSAAASSNIIAAISDGSLYVRGLTNLTTIPAAGNLLGETTALSNTGWTAVPGKSDWKEISCHIENWLAIDNNGNLYGAGKNSYGLQMNDLTSGVVNTLTLLDNSGDWIGIGTGRYHNMGMRGTVDANGVKSGTLYAWGQLHTGCIGNGISYRQDMKNTYGWTNNGTNVHTFAAKPVAGATVYTFEGALAIVGHTTDASDGTSIVVDGVTYTRNSTIDLVATSLYTKALTPVSAYTYAANGDVTGTTVYNDWFAFSTGYYHNAALRKNAAGKTEVYLWGDNEYGQFGNGNFVNETLQQSTLTEEAATMVELWSYATRINDARFDDAVEVRCSHYGTFIRCVSGKWYFAGCNKRNYLGTGTFSEETAFIPHFTELSTAFRNNDILVATYGAMIVRNSPRLANDADPVVRATLAYPLEPGQLDNAVTAAHNHSIDTAIIDAAAILVNQFATDIPNAITSKHTHNNLADLSAITIRNGVLNINNVPYISGGGSSESAGTGVTVDPTNLQLDSLTDVAGLSNLAGGFGLEILSYRKVSDNEAYIQVAPNSGVINCQGRYVTIYSKTETEILSAEIQSRGIYGVPSNGTAAFIYSSKDLVSMMETVAKSSSATLRLYYVDVAHAASPNTGTAVTDANNNVISFTGATLAGYLPLKWKLETSSVVNKMETQDVSELHSVGLGHYNSADEDFDTIYAAGNNGGYDELITKDQFNSNTYYFEDGSIVENIGSIVVPTGSVDSGETDGSGNPVMTTTYHSVYSDAGAVTEVISEETIKAGIYIKDGTMMVRVKQYMIPEKFDESLFGNSSIYIHPGTTNFSGMANQAYTFSDVAYTRETTAVDGVYPIKTAILRLTSAITDGDPNSTTEFKGSAGSLANPMVAAIYNPNRFSTSSVNGEYNSAVGFNSSATGNQVTVTGDFSNAIGICNVVTGDMTQVDGFQNIVVAGSSNVKGSHNIIGGDGNYAFGAGNVLCGYYTYAFGEGNTSLGVRGLLIGTGNFTNSDSIAVGRYNRLEKGSKYSIAIGSNLKVYAEGATVIGQVATVDKFEGFFPGEDLDTLYTITAANYTSAGYDTKWISYKNAMVFGAGHKSGSNDVTDITPFVFTKYIVKPNNAFFGASTGSANRKMDPYIYVPFLQHTFTGVINMQFTDAIADANDATKFTFTKRDGGRVKSFDPGIEVTDASSTTIDVDFNKATRWKLKDTVNTNVLIPKNFVDGAEAYVIIYGGVTVSWSAFANGGNVDESEDANNFDGIVWKGGSEPRSVDTMTTGFQMVKLMIVDNTVVGELVVDTCN